MAQLPGAALSALRRLIDGDHVKLESVPVGRSAAGLVCCDAEGLGNALRAAAAAKEAKCTALTEFLAPRFPKFTRAFLGCKLVMAADSRLGLEFEETADIQPSHHALLPQLSMNLRTPAPDAPTPGAPPAPVSVPAPFLLAVPAPAKPAAAVRSPAPRQPPRAKSAANLHREVMTLLASGGAGGLGTEDGAAKRKRGRPKKRGRSVIEEEKKEEEEEEEEDGEEEDKDSRAACPAARRATERPRSLEVLMSWNYTPATVGQGVPVSDLYHDGKLPWVAPNDYGVHHQTSFNVTAVDGKFYPCAIYKETATLVLYCGIAGEPLLGAAPGANLPERVTFAAAKDLLGQAKKDDGDKGAAAASPRLEARDDGSSPARDVPSGLMLVAERILKLNSAGFVDMRMSILVAAGQNLIPSSWKPENGGIDNATALTIKGVDGRNYDCRVVMNHANNRSASLLLMYEKFYEANNMRAGDTIRLYKHLATNRMLLGSLSARRARAAPAAASPAAAAAASVEKKLTRSLDTGHYGIKFNSPQATQLFHPAVISRAESGAPQPVAVALATGGKRLDCTLRYKVDNRGSSSFTLASFVSLIRSQKLRAGDGLLFTASLHDGLTVSVQKAAAVARAAPPAPPAPPRQRLSESVVGVRRRVGAHGGVRLGVAIADALWGRSRRPIVSHVGASTGSWVDLWPCDTESDGTSAGVGAAGLGTAMTGMLEQDGGSLRLMVSAYTKAHHLTLGDTLILRREGATGRVMLSCERECDEAGGEGRSDEATPPRDDAGVLLRKRTRAESRREPPRVVPRVQGEGEGRGTRDSQAAAAGGDDDDDADDDDDDDEDDDDDDDGDDDGGGGAGDAAADADSGGAAGPALGVDHGDGGGTEGDAGVLWPASMSLPPSYDPFGCPAPAEPTHPWGDDLLTGLGGGGTAAEEAAPGPPLAEGDALPAPEPDDDDDGDGDNDEDDDDDDSDEDEGEEEEEEESSQRDDSDSGDGVDRDLRALVKPEPVEESG